MYSPHPDQDPRDDAAAPSEEAALEGPGAVLPAERAQHLAYVWNELAEQTYAAFEDYQMEDALDLAKQGLEHALLNFPAEDERILRSYCTLADVHSQLNDHAGALANYRSALDQFGAQCSIEERAEILLGFARCHTALENFLHAEQNIAELENILANNSAVFEAEEQITVQIELLCLQGENCFATAPNSSAHDVFYEEALAMLQTLQEDRSAGVAIIARSCLRAALCEPFDERLAAERQRYLLRLFNGNQTTYNDYADFADTLAELNLAQEQAHAGVWLLREAEKIYLDLPPGVGPERQVADTHAALALRFWELKDFDSAEEYLVRAAGEYEQIFGQEHASYLAVLHKLITFYEERCEVRRAERLAAKYAAMCGSLYWEQSEIYLDALHLHARLLNTMGSSADEIAVIKQIAELSGQTYGRDSYAAADAKLELASAYNTAGNIDAARRCVREAGEQIGNDLENSDLRANLLFLRASLAAGEGEREGEVRETLHAIEALIDNEIDADEVQVLGWRCELADLYLAIGDEETAAGLAEEAAKEFERLPHDACKYLKSHFYWLRGALAEEAGERSEAQRFFKQSLALSEEIWGTDTPWNAMVLTALAGSLLEESSVIPDADACRTARQHLSRARMVLEDAGNEESQEMLEILELLRQAAEQLDDGNGIELLSGEIRALRERLNLDDEEDH